ncbi:hypothetical protein GLIP_3553 [Aliiglaciecola lipolytica E3]|uniref:Uncharacterized protein n=1 Tax=Aliiglaciecola lipolytica E3 TaxID=1127673 RepID=K6YY56_9ALTE|nr:hypothetical protein GLIP_3553 [Aliiglaciecola lipolytica E3]
MKPKGLDEIALCQCPSARINGVFNLKSSIIRVYFRKIG